MSDKEVGKPKFGKIRSVLWPIHNFELKKFLPMGIMMICILFIYTLCRDLKDTLVQTCATGGGSEMLSALKTWFVLPISFAFMAVFMKMSNKFSSQQMFYGVLTFFVIFYALFGFVLFPNIKYLHASIETITNLRQKFPWLYWIIPCFTNWTITLAYVIAELWGTAVIGLLYWQFANEITKTSEAPRFYSLFGMIGNFGLIASGEFVERLSKKAADQVGANQVIAFGQNLKWQMSFVIFFGISIMFIYAWMQKNVLGDPKFYSCEGNKNKKKKKKPKMGVMSGLKYVCTDVYVLLIAALVFSYGMSTVLIEQIWKSQVRVQYPGSNEYNAFMGGYSKRVGILTILLMIVGTNILKSCKWRTTALITPLFTGLGAILLFIIMIYKEHAAENILIFGQSLLNACVWVGAYQVGCIKGVKYSMFDSTKNMAYLPLDSDAKLKSQAAVEVVGSRLGKSGASTLIVILTNFVAPGSKITTPINMRIIMAASLIVVVLWTVSVVKINPSVVKKLEEKALEEKCA
ncbi:MAG: NTP/NDP exchange transporter [Clostridiales bacterium]|jgi:AAA family ATP:ADP antiporter|nr:NTP/NDP exchange transporter [Clostridiales bacterium]